MDKHTFNAIAGILVVTVIVLVFVAILMPEARHLEGYCEGKGYDGYRKIDSVWHCYRAGDGFIYAVPISVLKGEDSK